jgi:hypothetical protein
MSHYYQICYRRPMGITVDKNKSKEIADDLRDILTYETFSLPMLCRLHTNYSPRQLRCAVNRLVVSGTIEKLRLGMYKRVAP